MSTKVKVIATGTIAAAATAVATLESADLTTIAAYSGQTVQIYCHVIDDSAGAATNVAVSLGATGGTAPTGWVCPVGGVFVTPPFAKDDAATLAQLFGYASASTTLYYTVVGVEGEA